MDEQNGGPFYRDGLRFSCTRCSLCCRFDSGYVWLSRADVSRLAAGLDLPEKTVIDRYCHIVNIAGFKQLSLREQQNMDCVFWIDGACSVYGSRPLQCRSNPFWSHQLPDRATWNRAGDHCPGVNAGKLHSRADIDGWLEKRRLEPAMNADGLEE
ncbi:MAG: YkgJ family cysteine cluster protein [Spirochaetota bacterium]